MRRIDRRNSRMVDDRAPEQRKRMRRITPAQLASAALMLEEVEQRVAPAFVAEAKLKNA